MKALIQRVKKASVTVDNKLLSEIKTGLLVFLGVSKSDTTQNAQKLAQKILTLRIFEDENGSRGEPVSTCKLQAKHSTEQKLTECQVLREVELNVSDVGGLSLQPKHPQKQHGKMNKSLLDIQGEILIVSQFTLLGDCKKGTRPSFDEAAEPERAKKLYEEFIKIISDSKLNVKTGKFQAMMDIALINDGPVTFLIEK